MIAFVCELGLGLDIVERYEVAVRLHNRLVLVKVRLPVLCGGESHHRWIHKQSCGIIRIGICLNLYGFSVRQFPCGYSLLFAKVLDSWLPRAVPFRRGPSDCRDDARDH